MPDLTELQERLRAFRDERNWERFHDPKSLACAIGAEVGELLELVMWLNPDELSSLSGEALDAIRLELADILLFTINLANSIDIDLSAAVEQKIAINAQRISPAQDAPARKPHQP